MEDLGARRRTIIAISKAICAKLSPLFYQGKIQYFGINGKCNSLNFCSNYIMDIFPLSGRIDRNTFNPDHVHGNFFSKLIKDYVNNTEGGLKPPFLAPFCQFAVDYGDECNKRTDHIVFSIVPIFLWEFPRDLSEVMHSSITLPSLYTTTYP